MSGRSYGDAERAEAIGLAMTLGSREASKRTSIPRRTISYWLGKAAHGGQLAPIIEMTQRQMAERMWRTLAVAVDRLDATLADPKARLGDVAKATEILLNAHRLLAGQSTENVAVGIGEVAPAESGEVAPAESVVDMLALTQEQRDELVDALRAEISRHDLIERRRPDLVEQYDAEARQVSAALRERWQRVALTGETPPQLGSSELPLLGPGDEVPEPAEDAPLSDAEKEELLVWAKATGRL